MCGTYLRRHRGRLTPMRLVSIIVYCALAAEFLIRYKHDQPVRRSAPIPGEVLRGTTDKRMHRMVQAMATMTIFIVIRYFIPIIFACDCIPDVLAGLSTE